MKRREFVALSATTLSIMPLTSFELLNNMPSDVDYDVKRVEKA